MTTTVLIVVVLVIAIVAGFLLLKRPTRKAVKTGARAPVGSVA